MLITACAELVCRSDFLRDGRSDELRHPPLGAMLAIAVPQMALRRPQRASDGRTSRSRPSKSPLLASRPNASSLLHRATPRRWRRPPRRANWHVKKGLNSLLPVYHTGRSLAVRASRAEPGSATAVGGQFHRAVHCARVLVYSKNPPVHRQSLHASGRYRPTRAWCVRPTAGGSPLSLSGAAI